MSRKTRDRKIAMSFYILPKIFLLIIIFCTINFAQDKSRVEIFTSLKRAEITASPNTDAKSQRCETSARFAVLPKPVYAKEAKNLRVGGSVEVVIDFNEKGKILLIKPVSGQKILQPEAINAAQKVKFQPPVCGGTPVKVSILLTYNFIPSFPDEKYVAFSKAEELTNLKPDSQFYESIVNLTDNYGLIFGYADSQFYENAPLTSGDFAHFLRLTLDVLSKKAVDANKTPREINLFYSKNPQRVTSLSEIKNFEKNIPCAESVKILLLKYDIVLLNEEKEFLGNAALTQNEVINLWTEIFGAEAVPVNFQKVENNRLLITRGEFALFLEESLQVLSYKVLP